MMRLHSSLLVITLSLAAPLAGQAGPPASEPDPIPAGLPAAAGRYDPALDVLHYEVEIGLGHTESWIGGRMRAHIRATGRLERVVFDLSGLAVDGVYLDGAPVPWSLERGLLSARLPEGLDEGDQAGVEVHYRGVPDDGLIVGSNVHGQRSAFADNWPNRARFWMPVVDHPSDKATVRFLVHAPESWAVVANGRLVGQPFPTPVEAPGPVDGPRRSWVWTTNVPIPTYTMVIGAGPLVIDDVGLAACGRAPASARPDGCVEVTTWLLAPDVEVGAASFRRAHEMLDFFTELVGPYPYEKLAHVQSSTRFGGMENASAIFYSEQAISSGRDIEGTVSHETAHQWFGDSVTPADWPHLWLSEGFATYFGNLFFEYADGREAFDQLMAGAARSYLSSPDTLRPIVDESAANLFDLLNANSYQKGAWVLHMLRNHVGDEAFFDGVRLYYERHRDGVASTPDLLAAMEESTGDELAWFFDQWLHQPGHPVLEVRAVGSRVEVRQVQGDDAPVFRFPLELELRWEGGSRLVEVEVDEREESFGFDLPSDLVGVIVDPRVLLLHRETGR